MNLPLFFGLLTILSGVCLYLGSRASKQLNSVTDFFIASRSFGIFSLTMTLLGTQFGGGLMLGSAEEAYRYGWWVLFYPAGACLGLLLLAAGFGAKMQQAGVSTIAELFEKVYESRLLRKVAALLSIVSLFFILVAQAIAAQKFLVTVGLGNGWVFLLFWMVMILYTSIGGIRAVRSTDVFQVIFIVAACLLTFGVTLWNMPEVTVTPAIMEETQIPWMSWLLMPLLFMLIEQDMGECCFAAKTPRCITWATGITAVSLMAISLIPISYGLLAKQMGLPIAEGASVLMTAVQATTNPSIMAIFGWALLMVIFSTANALVCSISCNLSLDFTRGDNQQVKRGQWVTLATGLAATACSYLFDNVVATLMLAYELSVCCLLVPVVFAFTPIGAKTRAAGLAILGGAAGFLLFRFGIEPPLPRELAALLISLTGFGCGLLVDRLMIREVVSRPS